VESPARHHWADSNKEAVMVKVRYDRARRRTIITITIGDVVIVIDVPP
jgi:hypothetical protein